MDSGNNCTNLTVSPLFAYGQWHRAIKTSLSHSDSHVREQAEAKAESWKRIIEGIQCGSLKIGSRRPVEDTPAWVTLKVHHGGFASGDYIAGGMLLEHERQLAQRLQIGGENVRAAINRWYLSDDGQEALCNALDTKRIRVSVPEEAALPTAAWLLRDGRVGAALELIEKIQPWFDKLRFFPVIADSVQPKRTQPTTNLSTVHELRNNLRNVRVPRQVAAIREIVNTWLPLRDKLIELWLTTVRDGWPCATFPSDWSTRREAWFVEYDSAHAAAHRQYSKYTGNRGNFALFRDTLRKCEHDSSRLTGRQIGFLRIALKNTVARWGEPSSTRLASVRAFQRLQIAKPLHRTVAFAVWGRLANLPQDRGISCLERELRPVVVENGKAPVALPTPIVRRIRRTIEAPLEKLISLGIVSSGCVLANLLPELTGDIVAAVFEDPALVDLHSQTYRAFRRRRSLLLLNLEHQVKLVELPWVSVLEPLVHHSDAVAKEAREMLDKFVRLALRSYPGDLLPNPLIREFGALAKRAKLDMVFLEELAADIFMDTFTRKWHDAAREASTLLSGTVYANYYKLPTWDGKERIGRRWGKETAEEFAKVCKTRAEETRALAYSGVARKGMQVEQSQILTTHNLGMLTRRLNLEDEWREHGVELANRAFSRVLSLVSIRFTTRSAEFRILRRAAYAWRQAIFFMSFVSSEKQLECIAKLRANAKRSGVDWRFLPAINGLEDAMNGLRFDKRGFSKHGRQFLGWAEGRHWYPLK